MAQVPRINTRTLAMFNNHQAKYWQIGVLGPDIHIRFGRADMVDGFLVFRKTQKTVIRRATFNDAGREAERRYSAQIDQGYRPATPKATTPVYRPKRKTLTSKKRISVGATLKQIKKVEEFAVQILSRGTKRNLRSDRGGMPNYEGRYQRRLDGRRRVTDWVRIRFSKTYPKDVKVVVLLGDGAPASTSASLRSVRRSYLVR